MKCFLPQSGPDLRVLLGLFPHAEDVVDGMVIPAEQMPPPYQDLLVHEKHMTLTMESFHHGSVDVRILERQREGSLYARRILLVLRRSGQVVLYGLVRIDLRLCSPQVQTEILLGWKPLGRILIEHNVMRRIEPTAFLRVTPGPTLVSRFALPSAVPLFGRLAFIHCNEQPAIELLEILP
jgi:chorismate-pyruvate lyase